MNRYKKKWHKSHKKLRFRPQYPNESVVRFMNYNFPKDLKKRSKKRILDIGCGGGRHVKLFAESKFKTYGIDISKSGIQHTIKLLKKNDLKANVKYSDMHNLPFKENYFDGIISFGVFYYSDSKGMKMCIKEMYRVLKYGGKCFVNLRSTNDYRYGKGRKLETNTFVMNIKDTNEFNLKIHFLTKKQLYIYFKKFKKIKIEKNEFSYNNMKMLHSDWLISLIK